MHPGCEDDLQITLLRQQVDYANEFLGQAPYVILALVQDARTINHSTYTQTEICQYAASEKQEQGRELRTETLPLSSPAQTVGRR